MQSEAVNSPANSSPGAAWQAPEGDPSWRSQSGWPAVGERGSREAGRGGTSVLCGCTRAQRARQACGSSHRSIAHHGRRLDEPQARGGARVVVVQRSLLVVPSKVPPRPQHGACSALRGGGARSSCCGACWSAAEADGWAASSAVHPSHRPHQWARQRPAQENTARSRCSAHRRRAGSQHWPSRSWLERRTRQR